MDWKTVVKNVAPVIGTALGGPMGGSAVKFLTGKLLGDETAPESDLEAFITTANPEQLFKLKQLDVEFKVQMRQLGVDVMKLDAADRASARTLAHTDMRPHILLSGLYTFAYAALVWAVITGRVQAVDSMMALVMAVVGSLTAGQTQILNFWFGSSSGSKTKEQK